MFDTGQQLATRAKCTCLDIVCSCNTMPASVPAAKDAFTEYLEALWEDAEIQARKELRLTNTAALTPDQHDQIHERASALVDMWQVHDVQDKRMRRIMAQQHDDVVDGLAAIKQAVDRSAVAANALDFATRHPFLAGFFGRSLFDKFRGQ